MARQSAIPDTAADGPPFADAFVIFAVPVLSLAIGAWFLLRLNLAVWSGTVAALAVDTLLLAVHLAVRRSLLAQPAPAHAAGWVGHARARAERSGAEGEIGSPPARREGTPGQGILRS